MKQAMSGFKGRHFEGGIVLWVVRWYCRYGISYCDLEQMAGPPTPASGGRYGGPVPQNPSPPRGARFQRAHPTGTGAGSRPSIPARICPT